MKGLLIFFLLLSSCLRAQEPIVTPNYVEFVKKLDTFNRKLLGCPLEPDYITKEDCHPRQGVLDMKLWKELRERGARIFTGPEKGAKAPRHPRP